MSIEKTQEIQAATHPVALLEQEAGRGKSGWSRTAVGAIMQEMVTLKAIVKNGRLVVDEPTSFPDGTTLNLTIADEEEELDAEEAAALEASLARGLEQIRTGQHRPAEEILQELKARR